MFDELPTEILITIFGYLSHSDRKSCRLTCQHFYRATLTNSFMRKDYFQIDRRMLKPNGKLIATFLSNIKRMIYHASVSNMNNHYFWIFNKLGENLQSLTLKSCTVDYFIFSYILSKFQSIETLHIVNCDNLLIEGKIFLPTGIKNNQFLCKLKGLEISDTMYLTDIALSRFLIIFPNINHLSLENTIINCHSGVYNFNYNINSNILKNPSPNVLTIHYLGALINSKQHNIKSLNLAKTILNNEALSQILQIEKLKLYYLNINFCHELKQNEHMLIGSWQPGLTELQIANCDLLTDYLFEHICKTMPNLKILNMSKNRNVTGIAFRYLNYLVHLTDLDISDCPFIAGTLIAFVICSNNLIKTLRKVKLNKTKISNENVIDIATMLTLFELEISYCDRLTSVCLSTLFEKQKLLKRLEMASVRVNDAGMTGFSESSLNLPLVDIKYENTVTPIQFLQKKILKESERYYNVIVSSRIKSSPCIQDLQNLEILNLNGCNKLTDYIFASSIRFTNLRELKLAGLSRITTKTLFFLAYNCPAIEILNLSACSVDDKGICVLVQKLKRLKHLYLNHCLEITNVALIFIIEHCKVLQKLSILGCSNLKEDLLNKIKNMPNMVEIIGNPNENFEMESNAPLAPPLPISNMNLI